MHQKFYLSVVSVVLCVLLTSPSFASIMKMKSETSTLPNGLKIILIQYPSPGILAYNIAVHAGSRNEVEEGKTGFAHFFEHLMFKGSKNRSAKEFNDIYVKIGNENNANTSLDITRYHGTVAKEYLSHVLENEADRFANLHFEESALIAESGAVMGEYDKSLSHPFFQLEEKMASTAFKVHPYKHTTMGFKEDIQKYATRYKDVWPFFKRYYRPSNTTVVLVGDVDFKRHKKQIQEKFGKWKDPQFSPVEIPKEPEQGESRNAEIRLNSPSQTWAVIGFKAPAFSTKNKDSAALQILAEAYFSQVSDFQKEFVYEKKWLDLVMVDNSETLDPYLWSVVLRFSEEGKSKEKEVLKALGKLLDEAREKPLSLEKLKNVKERLQNQTLISWFEDPEHLASQIAFYTNLEPDLGVMDRIVNQRNAVEPNDLQRVARMYLTDVRKTTVFLRGK